MLRRNDFIERSLAGALSFLKEAVFSDACALDRGFLQSLDPRIKIITFVLFIIRVLFTRDIVILLFLYALCLALAYYSKINLGFFLKRTWVFIPLFSLFIVIPALFSFVTPGEVLVSFSISGLKLTITRPGLSGAVLFTARVATSVSFAVLLGITTRHFALLKALRAFGIPQIFVFTIGMCYVYIYFFMEIIEHTCLAVKSRSGAKIHYKRGQRIVAWNIAYLWARSYQLNEEVYLAMLSRGYSGEPAALDDFRVGTKDWLWLAGVLIWMSLSFH